MSVHVVVWAIVAYAMVARWGKWRGDRLSVGRIPGSKSEQALVPRWAARAIGGREGQGPYTAGLPRWVPSVIGAPVQIGMPKIAERMTKH